MALRETTKAAFIADLTDPKHGTPTGYQYGCREACCREAHRLRDQARRQGLQVPRAEYEATLARKVRDRIEDVDFCTANGDRNPDSVARRVGLSNGERLNEFLCNHQRLDLWARMELPPPNGAEALDPNSFAYRATLRVHRDAGVIR